MTKKDYILLANWVKHNYAALEPATTQKPGHRFIIWCMVHELADTLQNDNPRFNKEKFIKACQMN